MKWIVVISTITEDVRNFKISPIVGFWFFYQINNNFANVHVLEIKKLHMFYAKYTERANKHTTINKKRISVLRNVISYNFYFGKFSSS